MLLKEEYKLYKHQEDIIDWLLCNRYNEDNIKGSIIFMKMGLGKTLTSLEYLNKLYSSKMNKMPSLIICSKSIINEWICQIDKFYKIKPKYLILHNNFNKIIEFSKEDICKYDFVITTYNMVSIANKKVKWSNNYIKIEKTGFRKRLLFKKNHGILNKKDVYGINLLYSIKWESIICDEVQKISNPRSKLYKSVYSLSSNFNIGLSGTPIKNNKRELISLLKYIGLNSSELVNFSKWNRYKIPEFVYKYIKKTTYEDANIVLPNVSEKIIKLEMNEYTKEVFVNYYEYLNYLITSYKESVNKVDKSFAPILALFTRLRQICNDTILLNNNKLSKEQYCNIMGDVEIKNNNIKINKINEIIEEVENRKEKIIIFSAFTSYLHIIEKENKKVIFIKSEDSINKRLEKINYWKKSKKNNVLMMNYTIGAEGLNLVESNNVLLIDTWWNNALEEQAIARVKRIGQTKKINVYRLLMKSSIEELMYEKSQSKKGIFEKLKNEEKLDIKKMGMKELQNIINILTNNKLIKIIYLYGLI